MTGRIAFSTRYDGVSMRAGGESLTCDTSAPLRAAMTLNSRLVVVLFAALFVLAQQEAAVHAIGHLPELLAGHQHSDDEDEAPHKCPDCARFAAVSVGAAASDSPTLKADQGRAPLVHAVVVAIARSPLERPRNRSPPQS